MESIHRRGICGRVHTGFRWEARMGSGLVTFVQVTDASKTATAAWFSGKAPSR